MYILFNGNGLSVLRWWEDLSVRIRFVVKNNEKKGGNIFRYI